MAAQETCHIRSIFDYIIAVPNPAAKESSMHTFRQVGHLANETHAMEDNLTPMGDVYALGDCCANPTLPLPALAQVCVCVCQCASPFVAFSGDVTLCCVFRAVCSSSCFLQDLSISGSLSGTDGSNRLKHIPTNVK